MVRIHAVVFMFQIFKDPKNTVNPRIVWLSVTSIPFEADAKSISSELRLKVRTSVRCPGRSTEKARVASGVES